MIPAFGIEHIKTIVPHNNQTTSYRLTANIFGTYLVPGLCPVLCLLLKAKISDVV